MCQVVESRAFSFRDFEGHVERSVPVLVKDALQQSSWDRARDRWANRSSLLLHYGSAPVLSGAIPYASVFDMDEEAVPLKSQLAQAAAQVCGPTLFPLCESLLPVLLAAYGLIPQPTSHTCMFLHLHVS